MKKESKIIAKTGSLHEIFEFAKKYENEADFKALGSAVLRSKHLASIVEFAKLFPQVNIKKFERTIIKSGNVDMMVLFASSVKGANIEVIQKNVIKFGTPKQIIEFAIKVPEAKISDLEDAIIKYGDAEEISEFANTVKGANVEENINTIEDDVLATNNIEEICRHADTYAVVNKQKIIDYIVTNFENGASAILRFVKTNQVKNVEFFEDAILAYGEPKTIIQFAKTVNSVNFAKIEDKIIQIGNADYIVDLARIQGVNVEKLQEAIISICSESKMYTKSFMNWTSLAQFAKFVKGADVARIQDLIIESGSSLAILDVAHAEGADINKLQAGIIKTKDVADMVQFALFIPGANFDLLIEEANKVDALRLPGVLYACADKPKFLTVDLTKVEDAIIKTGSVKFITKLAEVEGYNSEKLLNAVKTLSALKPDGDGDNVDGGLGV